MGSGYIFFLYVVLNCFANQKKRVFLYECGMYDPTVNDFIKQCVSVIFCFHQRRLVDIRFNQQRKKYNLLSL